MGITIADILVFDAGDLRSDPQGSRKVLESLMADMTGQHYGGTKVPVVKAHDDIFRRLSAVRGPQETTNIVANDQS